MDIRPSLEDLRVLAATHGERPYPLVCELLADLETPVSAYLKVAREPYGMLLESVAGGEQVGRYSFICAEPQAVVTLQGGRCAVAAAGETIEHERHGLDVLAELVGRYEALPAGPGSPWQHLPRFTGGAIGYLGYEIVRTFERLPLPAGDPYGLPTGVWMLVDSLLAFDHVRHTIAVIANVLPGPEPLEQRYERAAARIAELVGRLQQPLPHAPAPAIASKRPRQLVASNLSTEQYRAAIERCKEYIRAGDIFQVVFSQRFSRPTDADPFAIYRALRVVNPSPYMYYLSLPQARIIGASPEMLVRVEDGVVETHPIAGTRRRGRDAADEERMAAELLADQKERAEHLMLVDLGRNDIGRVSQPGTVGVPQFMEIERYSHVMHLVSKVTGTLRPELSATDALRACFPAGTVSGAPKVRAMEIIAELEPDQRGPYAGCIGYLSFAGQLDTAITIRTVVLREGVAHVQAGGGIVADSNPEQEELETRNKAGAVMAAIDLAEQATPTPSSRA